MRRVLAAFGLLMILCASAEAAKLHRLKPPNVHLPGQRPAVPKGFAVPGWTDEETQKWLDNGSAGSGLG